MFNKRFLPSGFEAPSRWRSIVGLVCLLAAHPAFAINGFFIPGYGAKSLAVAGTGVAMPQDTLTTAINPAGLALIEPGIDAHAMLLHPQREGSLDCTGIGGCSRPVADRSSREFFVVPGGGYSKRLNDDTTVGFAMYANGGLNTSYGRALYDETAQRIAGRHPGDPGFPTRGKIGVDFSQIIFAPGAAYRATSRWTLGIAPLVILQKFSTRGFNTFAPLSADPTSLNARGADYEFGVGVRVGAIYQLLPKVRLGAQYTSPLFVHTHTKYSGLFVDGGHLDSPPHFTLGLSWEASAALTVGFDYQRILFAAVDTIGNRGPSAAELAGQITPARRLGGVAGLGFGWRDLSVYKAGAIYKVNDKFTLRGGWNHNDGTVPSSQALLAPIVPAAMQDDVTAGFSYRLSGSSDISVAYMHAFGATTKNPHTAYFGVPVKAWAAADGLDIAFGRRF